jgi:hypothetical protein
MDNIDNKSKLRQAYELYSQSSDRTRQTIIKLFQEKLQLSFGTSSTYYHIIKKKYINLTIR